MAYFVAHAYGGAEQPQSLFTVRIYSTKGKSVEMWVCRYQIGAKDIAEFVPHCPKTKMNYALKFVVSSGKGEAKNECNIPLMHCGDHVELSAVRSSRSLTARRTARPPRQCSR
jgi:hypothetical protein